MDKTQNKNPEFPNDENCTMPLLSSAGMPVPGPGGINTYSSFPFYMNGYVYPYVNIIQTDYGVCPGYDGIAKS